jgi:hypothetical protein
MFCTLPCNDNPNNINIEVILGACNDNPNNINIEVILGACKINQIH